MAVSVDTVYQRVLAIANKEQRGYITPQEFNLLANQAQMEIFEQYFYDINQFEKVRGNSTEYSDMVNLLEEKLSIFKASQGSFTITQNAPGYAPTFGSNLLTGDNSSFDGSIGSFVLNDEAAGTLTHDSGTQQLKLSNLSTTTSSANTIIAKQSLATTQNALYRVKGTINATNLAEGDTAKITFGTRSSNLVGGMTLPVEFYATVYSTSTDISCRISSSGSTEGNKHAFFDDLEVSEVNSNRVRLDEASIYRLGSVVYTDPSGRQIDVQRLTTKEYSDVSSGPLTKPSTSRPYYVKIKENEISLYPSSIATATSFNYILRPSAVVWAYTVINEKAMFDGMNAVDFQLHASEEVHLVDKILQLAGLVMQKPDVVTLAKDKIITDIQQKKA